MHYELSGVLTDDALIYLAMGRGILNGLLPYSDLFETKPPGIFLLNAASLYLTGDVGPLKMLQALVLLTIAGVVPVGTWMRVKNLPRNERTIALLLSMVFGLLLSLYTATMAGEGQVESFGAAFALLALLGMSIERRCMTILGILGAVGVKEPFLFSIIAGALILHSRTRSLFNYPAFAQPPHGLRPAGKATAGRQFFIVHILAIAIGLALLALLGYLVPYLTIYLPHMLGTHAVAHVPLWQRSFAMDRFLANIASFSIPLAGGTVVLLLGTLAAGLHNTTTLAASAWTGRWFFGLYLTLMAIGIGGDFYGHHFVFAVPFLVACLWVFVTALEERTTLSLHMATTLFVTCLIGAAAFHSRSNYAAAKEAWQHRRTELTQMAATIDTIMDRCGFDRYLHLKPKGGGPFAYTRHSPEGPIFTQYSRFMGFEGSPFIEPFKQVLLRTPLILLTDLDAVRMTEVAKRYIRTSFTPDHPTCAGDIPPLPVEYSLLFRP